jgi:hypothetical protein
MQVAILSRNIGQLVEHCSRFDMWLTAHLVQLCERTEMLAEIGQEFAKLGFDCTLAQWYKLSLAESMLGTPELWDVALEWFVELGHVADGFLRRAVTCRPLETPEQVEKMIRFCTEHGLQDAADEIHRVAGRHALDRGDLARAIEHFSVASQDRQVAEIVKRMLIAFKETGDTSFVAVAESLQALGSTIPEVRLLVDYRAFRLQMDAHKYQEAGKTLVGMFGSPKQSWFWDRLLLDSALLLNIHGVVFGRKDTVKLMHYLHQLVGFRRAGVLQGSAAQLDEFKFALSQNLSLAITDDK